MVDGRVPAFHHVVPQEVFPSRDGSMCTVSKYTVLESTDMKYLFCFKGGEKRVTAEIQRPLTLGVLLSEPLRAERGDRM